MRCPNVKVLAGIAPHLLTYSKYQVLIIGLSMTDLLTECVINKNRYLFIAAIRLIDAPELEFFLVHLTADAPEPVLVHPTMDAQELVFFQYLNILEDSEFDGKNLKF